MKKYSVLVAVALVLSVAFPASAATLKGVNRTKITAVPAQLVGQGEQGGKIRAIYDTYELTADVTTGQKFEMGGLLPSGARVIDAVVFFDDLDGGSSGTVQVGWSSTNTTAEADDVDGFLVLVDVNTAAGSQSMQGDQPTTAGNFKQFSADVQPTLTVQGDTNTSSGTLSLLIMYLLD